MTSSTDEKPKIVSSDFTIDHILNRAGNCNSSSCARSGDVEKVENSSLVPLPWLRCTRYCPPKIPRNQRKEGIQKRQLGRHPRIPFTTHQLQVLEEKFQQSSYLSSEEVTKLSRGLQLADIRVKIWFQNRRARERRERQTSSSEHRLEIPTESKESCAEYQNKNVMTPVSIPLPMNYMINPANFFNLEERLPSTQFNFELVNTRRSSEK